MKFKRSLSLILALCMMISLIPALSVSAAEGLNTINYVFSREALKSSSNVSMSNQDTANNYDNIDTKKSDKWDYLAGRSLIGGAFRSGIMSNAVKEGHLGIPSNGISFMIYVDKPGTYIPSLTYAPYKSGAIVNTYIVKAEYAEKQGWNMSDRGAGGGIVKVLNATEGVILLGTADTFNSKLGTATVDNTKTDTFAAVTLEEGDYYLVFAATGVTTGATPQYNEKNGNHYYYWLTNLTFKEQAPPPGDFDKVEMTLRGIETGDPIALKSVRDIRIKLTDKNGTELVDIDEEKLEVEITSDSGCAVITEAGKLDAASCGEATITARVKYKDISREASLDIKIEQTGKNLLSDEQNPDMEGDAWPWSLARQDEAPDTPWWIRAKVGTVEKDGDAENRALGIEINPEASVLDLYTGNPPSLAFKASADGPRVPVKTGQFYLFTFKVKLENWTVPSGAKDMNLNFQLYPYPSKSATKAISGYNRSMWINSEADYKEKYSEWQTVTIPVSAEFLAETDDAYFTPVLVFRPENTETETDFDKKGYGGTVWFDDFELREVGFSDVEVEVIGETDLGEKSALTVNIKPRTATGHYISLDESCIPKCMDIASSNSYIIGEILTPERTVTTTGSGIYYASAASSLDGMNGTAEISADMSLNGISRSGSASVTVSNFAAKLMYAEAEAEPVAVGDGNTTQIEVRAFDTNGDEVDLSDAKILYKSQSKNIVSVSETGIVTPVAAGTGFVDVTVISGGVAVVTTAEIHVTDGTPIESAHLSGATEVGHLRDLPLTVTGVSESGYASDIGAADIEWVVSNDSISVSEDGYMFGNTLGETAEIYAEVTLNGNTVKTNTISVTVVESDLRSFKIDFADTRAATAADITLEKDGWEVDYANSASNIRPILNNIGIQMQNTTAGSVASIKVNVPYSGYYTVLFRGRTYGAKAAEDADIYLDGTYIGDYSFFYKSMSMIMPAETMRTVYLEAGPHEFRFRTNENTSGVSTSYNMVFKDMYFLATNELPAIIGILAEELVLEKGDAANVNAVMQTEDGFMYEWQPRFDGTEDTMVSVKYNSADESIATVDIDGNVMGIKPGETYISVTAKTKNSELTERVKVVVTDVSDAEEDTALASAEIGYQTLVMSINSNGINLSVVAKNAEGKALSLENATVVWKTSNECVATVIDGAVKPVSCGVADITAEITIGEVVKTATVTVSVRNGKVSRTYYTDERVEAARENAAEYNWGKDLKKSAVEAADKYVALGNDYLWKMIPGNSIPRTWQIGLTGDPDIYICRYCGENVQNEYGVYPWVTDPIGRPWKIQCPSCKRLFPSNDFEKLYEIGLDESTGVYNVEIAHRKNAEIVAESGGKTNYLKNTLYPEVANDLSLLPTEKAETWGVDDGLGYDTGALIPNGKKKVYTFIAYYHLYGLWYSSADHHAAEIKNAITTLADAYLYTGDEKYGRAGAIMMDRIADVYPEFCTTDWIAQGYYFGNSKNGKMLNNIWQSTNDQLMAKAYDAFFPAYDDPGVISFLNEKSEKYNGLGDKSTAEVLRTNVETNYLSEIYTAVREADVKGNFGMHQAALAAAAVVLDTHPKTDEMLDWIFSESKTDGYLYNTGGGVAQQLVNDVSRDGQGYESAAGYNRIWVTQIFNLAEILGIYDEYNGMDLWSNPKYIGMIKSYNPMTVVRRGQPSIGDSGISGWFAQLLDDPDILMNAYKNVKDIHYESAVEIAQEIYRLNMYADGNLKNLHYDIFTKNPESIQRDVLDIIEQYGEYPFDKSSMMTGYGFGALRAGSLYEDDGTSAIRDTTRDFWMYFGGGTSHRHLDALNLGIEAYGISMTADNGYPEQTGYHPNRHQWTRPTISHNTVVVDEKSQNDSMEPFEPLHFDTKDTRVKVMDVDASDVYTQTSEYRRTLVMIDYDDEVSYGIDFFKILGGDDHLYSFHSAGENVSSYSSELEFEQQMGGSYAGIDVPFGNDPYTDPTTSYKKLKYPDGYTWLEDVRRSQNPGQEKFFVDFDIMDIQKLSRNPWSKMDINLRMTMVNDFKPDEVTLAIGYPPRTENNLKYVDHYQYMLVRRTGKDLNTLFTTVIEPYNKNRYIEEIERVGIEVSGDSAVQPSETDKAAALKITLANGNVDYVIYAQNNDVTYTVTDNTEEAAYSFDFKGFVGVWTVNDKRESVYSYINDGEVIADVKDVRATIEGTINSFTRDLAFDNFIEVVFDEKVESAEMLEGRLMNVDSPAPGNAAYVIEKVSLAEDGMSAVLDIGSVTLIDSYIDDSDINSGYNYDIAEGQTFTIALSHEDNKAPVFEKTSDITTSAGSSVSVTVSAESPAESGNAITYVARTLPRGGNFNPDTATFTWRPDDSQVGDNLVAIDAVDEYGRSSTAYFTVTVYGKTTGAGADKTETPSIGTTETPSGGAATEDKTDVEGNTDKTNETENTETGASTPDASGETDVIRFTDLSNHAWAEYAINTLAADGIIKGTSGTTYSPAANITRADFALLLVRAFKLTSDNTENFADVSASDYFAPELAIARNTGIVNGIGDNKFAPRNTITRQDMMVIVYRALNKLGVVLKNADVSYDDFADVADYAKEAVFALISVGLVNGKSGKIAPADYTTRAEVAVLIKRILDYMK